MASSKEKSGREKGVSTGTLIFSLLFVLGLIALSQSQPIKSTTTDNSLNSRAKEPTKSIPAVQNTPTAPVVRNDVVDFATQPGRVAVQQGDLRHHGGTPTVRESFMRNADNPATTNDESNDQPLGHFGKATIMVTNISSGNSYPLDADVEDNQVKRIYFEKGGWVDFDEAQIDEGGNGEGTDEQGRQWTFDGYERQP